MHKAKKDNKERSENDIAGMLVQTILRLNIYKIHT